MQGGPGVGGAEASRLREELQVRLEFGKSRLTWESRQGPSLGCPFRKFWYSRALCDITNTTLKPQRNFARRDHLSPRYRLGARI